MKQSFEAKSAISRHIQQRRERALDFANHLIFRHSYHLTKANEPVSFSEGRHAVGCFRDRGFGKKP